MRSSSGDIFRRAGGTSGVLFIGRLLLLIEFGALALVLSSCGGDDPRPAEPSPPARLQQGREPDAGDEEGIRYRVTVRMTDGGTTVEPAVIAAFLPADIRVLNRTRRQATVRVAGVGRTTVDGDAAATLSTPGLKAGRYRIDAPGGDAVLTARAGG